MFKIIRLDHIYICVPEGKEHEADQFYRDVLGFEPKTRAVELNQSSGYWYQVADMEIHIGTDNHPVNPKPHFALQVSDIEGARRHLESYNLKFKEEIPIAGRKRFAFYDPYGNRIELIEYSNSSNT